MKFSTRQLFIGFTIIGVLILLAKNHIWYNHEVANFEINSSHDIRVWTEGYVHRQKLRKMLFTVRINGKPFDEPDVVQFRSYGETNNVKLATDKDKRFFCVYSPNNDDLVILGDSLTNEFLGTFSLRFPPDTFPRYPHSVEWQKMIDKINNDNPGVEICLPKQRGKP